MVRQVGDDLLMEEGIAKRGILIRHLVIPGFITNSLEVLGLIKKHISLSVPLSIMSQYTPMPSRCESSPSGEKGYARGI